MATESAREFVERWKKLGPILEEQREKDIRATDTKRAMKNLAVYVQRAVRENPPPPTSGLTIAQRLFRKAHANGPKPVEDSHG